MGVRVVYRSILVLLLLGGGTGATAQQTPFSYTSMLNKANQDMRDGVRLVEAEETCTRIIGEIGRPGVLNPDANLRGVLEYAYELRARLRFLHARMNETRDYERVKQDLRSFVQINPGVVLGVTKTEGEVFNTVFEDLFRAVRGESVGTLRLKVIPADADVRIDGVPRTPGDIPLLEGTHDIQVTKSGYAPSSPQVVLTANVVTTHEIELDRLSSIIAIVTSPPGVDVLVDGKLRGRTDPGPLQAPYDSREEVRGLTGERSRALEIQDVGLGDYMIEVSRDCYTADARKLPIVRHNEFVVAIQLTQASATLNIDGSPGAVYLDETRIGVAPGKVPACPGERLIEVRTDVGKSVHRLEVKAHGEVPVRARIRPAVAILNAPDLGTPRDLRRDVEAALVDLESLTLWAPAEHAVNAELQERKLKTGWLSFDEGGKPLDRGLTKTDRQRFGSALARRFGAQAVAEIAVPNKDEPRNLVLTLLADGSSIPDVIPLNLDRRDSVEAAKARLAKSLPLFTRETGIEMVDIDGAAGPVVVRQPYGDATKMFLEWGDVITAVDGQTVRSTAEFAARLAQKKPGELVSVAATKLGGPSAGRTVTVGLNTMPVRHLIGLYDTSVDANKSILDLKFRLASLDTEEERSMASMNLAVALMHIGDWSGARAELEKVKLDETAIPAGHKGVSNGTVQFLIGECLDKLNMKAEATVRFQMAASIKGARLTADGPLISDLVQARPPLRER